jgi:hypothetical protein
MSTGFDPKKPSFDDNVRTLQIIHGALAAGVSFFLAIVVLMIRKGEILGKQPWSVTPMITMVAILFAVAAIVAHVVIPSLLVTSQRKAMAKTAKTEQGDFDGMVALYTTQKIVAAALLEGAAFFNTIAYFLEGTAIPLLLALLLVVLILNRIPSRDGMTRWIDAQLAQLREERHLG